MNDLFNDVLTFVIQREFYIVGHYFNGLLAAG